MIQELCEQHGVTKFHVPVCAFNSQLLRHLRAALAVQNGEWGCPGQELLQAEQGLLDGDTLIATLPSLIATSSHTVGLM